MRLPWAGGVQRTASEEKAPSRLRARLAHTAAGANNHHPALATLPVQSTKPEEASRSYERHFDHTDELVSRIT